MNGYSISPLCEGPPPLLRGVVDPSCARHNRTGRRDLLRAALFVGKCFMMLSAFNACTFDLQGHRGARGLAPENTLEAFAVALSLGVSTLELDTAVTRDGVVVVAHDRRLNPDITRSADGQWLAAPTPAVGDLDYSDLQRYDVGRINPQSEYSRRFPTQRSVDGARMPSLAAVFELARRAGNDSVRFNIETKLSPFAPEEAPSPEVFAGALVRLAATAGMTERVTIQSFDWRTLRIVQEIEPRMATSYLSAQQPWTDNIAAGGSSAWTAGLQLRDYGSVPEMVKAAASDEAGRLLGSATWSPWFGDLSAESVRQAQALGLRVLPWTVNEEADIARMIDWGGDGLITDYPDRARTVMRQKGLALPAATPVEP
jgi:glycerophosphoryl diester phosphodiesterase